MDENTYEAIRLENAGYLLWFKDYLVDHGLSIKTVDRHLNNLDFFLNDFLRWMNISGIILYEITKKQLPDP